MGAFLTRAKRETEVLVVGGGAAGALAAIRAAEMGCRPLVIVKGPFPSGSSLMARSGFSAAIGHGDPRDSPEQHLRDSLLVGTINDEELARIMTHDIVPLVEEMVRWGIDLVRRGDRFHQRRSQYHTYPRGLHNYDQVGKSVMDCLVRRARELPIEVLHSTMLVDLILEGGQVLGAVALDHSDGELMEIRAKSVVLAAGGAGQVYPLSDMPRYQTGDAQAAAWRAGAEMIDLEFVEFQLTTGNPGLRGYPPATSQWIMNGGRLYNGLHERFMRRFGPDVERQPRSTINRAVSLEVFERRGTANGTVYLDLTHLSLEEMNRIGPDIVARFQRAGIDLTYQPMQVVSGCHSFLGGVKIDADCATNLPGLFAGGEVTGGVHGADRLGGNALTEALVFGARAGARAARAAAGRGAPREAGDTLHRVGQDLEELLEKGEIGQHADPEAVIAGIREAMAGAHVIRTRESLEGTLQRLEEISERRLPALAAGGETRTRRLRALRSALEARNLALVGKLVATAALLREESRGFQLRLDFPGTDDLNWRKSIVLARDGEGIRHRYLPRGAGAPS